MTLEEKQTRNIRLQEEADAKLVADIEGLKGEPKEVKAKLRDIASSVIKGRRTDSQKKRIAQAICARVEAADAPVDVTGTEWYPKIKNLAKD